MHSGAVRALVGEAEPQYASYTRPIQARRSIGYLAHQPSHLPA